MRRLIAFPCAGQTLFGTLDEAAGETGLLIVSGGNEIRMGAHRGMAELAARLAEAGVPVFRFDRRGIGDSTGTNAGFESSAPDIAAAAAIFAAETRIKRLVAFGNCDAASALALWHPAAGFDALVLANPWVIEATDDMPPATAIRARYAERLRDPQQWLRLARGGVDIGKLFKGLRHATSSPSEIGDLATRIASGLANFRGPISILLARGDNTAIAFRNAWRDAAFDPIRERTTIAECETASHSFAQASDKDWLFEQLLSATR